MSAELIMLLSKIGFCLVAGALVCIGLSAVADALYRDFSKSIIKFFDSFTPTHKGDWF